MENESLKSKTAKGIFWGGISTGVQQLLGFVFGVYLARELTADDYGLVGLLTIFSLIASSIQESGFISALANKKAVEHRDYNAVFWASICMSLVLYMILFLCAPLISAFFDMPELTLLARVLFLGFVCGSFGVVHSAYLFRNLKVKQRSLAATLSVLMSGLVAIGMVYQGFSYWGLVAQTISYSFCFSLICFLFSNFRPSFRIDMAPVREMWGFSSKILAANIVNHINNHVLALYLGRVSTKATVGYYSQANKWTSMVQGVVANMSHGFAQPLFANLDGETERQNRVFKKLLHFICFASFPALALLCIIAHEFIVMTITDKWLPSVPLLQVLCIGGAFLPIINFYSNYILSKGASKVYMRNVILFGLIQLLLIIVLGAGNIFYLVLGVALFTVLWAFVWQFAVAKLSTLPYRQLSLIILKYLALVVVLGAVSYVVGGYVQHLLLSALVKVILFLSLYLLTLYLFRSVVLWEIMGHLKERYGGKRKTQV